MQIRNFGIPWRAFEELESPEFEETLVSNCANIINFGEEILEFIKSDGKINLLKDIDHSLFDYFFIMNHQNHRNIPVSVIIFEGFIYLFQSIYSLGSSRWEFEFYPIRLIAPIREVKIKFNWEGFLRISHKSLKIYYQILTVGHNKETDKKNNRNALLNRLSQIKDILDNQTQNEISPLEIIKQSKYYPPSEHVLNLYGLNDDDFDDLRATFKEKITNRDISLNRFWDLAFLKDFTEISLQALNQIIFEQGIKEFSIVDVTRSTNPKIPLGTYIYELTDDGRITLIKNPLKFIMNYSFDEYETIDTFALFDKKSYEDSLSSIVVIQYNEIKDFQLFGTEMMINRVETIELDEIAGTIDSPKLLGTAFKELFFGSAYANLKGMSAMMQQLNQTLKSNKVTIQTISEIKDTRIVQVILKDKTDIEFKGISIYYDFNRKMGNVKNKEIQYKDTKKESNTNLSEKADNLSKLKEYKLMLEEGLIDEDEFKDLKKKTLGL